VTISTPAPPHEPARVSRLEAGRYSEPTPEKGRRHGALGILLVLGMVLAGSFLGLLTVLLMFFQLATGYGGIWYGVDPFDQPAVESGKIITRRYLGA